MIKLAKRFRFGNWDFGKSGQIDFCGAAIVQSLDYQAATVSLRDYVAKIKPITVEKVRETMSDVPCDEKEHRQLRAMVGALSWTTNACRN